MPLYEMMKAHLEDEVDSLNGLQDFISSLSDDMREQLSDEIAAKKEALSGDPVLEDITNAEIVDVIMTRDGLRELVLDELSEEDPTNGEEVTELVGTRWQVLGDNVEEAVKVATDNLCADAAPENIDQLAGWIADNTEDAEAVLSQLYAVYDAVEGSYECPLVSFDDENQIVPADAAAEALADFFEEAEDVDPRTQLQVGRLFVETEDAEDEEQTEMPERFEGLGVVDEVYNPEAARTRIMKWVSTEDGDAEKLDQVFLTTTQEYTDTGLTVSHLIPVGDIEDGELVLNRQAVATAQSRVADSELVDDEKESLNALIEQAVDALGIDDQTDEVPADLLQTAERLGIEDAEAMGYTALLAAVRDASANTDQRTTDANDRKPTARDILRRLR